MLFTPFIVAVLGGSAIAQMSMSVGMNSGMSMDPSISMSMPMMTSSPGTMSQATDFLVCRYKNNSINNRSNNRENFGYFNNAWWRKGHEQRRTWLRNASPGPSRGSWSCDSGSCWVAGLVCVLVSVMLGTLFGASIDVDELQGGAYVLKQHQDQKLYC
ncbi:hypothetical protein Purlil1_12511 [Purpureocillium lilacinum]|uniref:Uncharacterized protein n=1 Tax=Purpureocillium lilacinum TaxID=33203 RepID=A0ABR0BGM1_PURLI|nr:hypothetical protein Purlil1_12511 [Purpureocillium lilacinum]